MRDHILQRLAIHMCSSRDGNLNNTVNLRHAFNSKQIKDEKKKGEHLSRHSVLWSGPVQKPCFHKQIYFILYQALKLQAQFR